MRDPPAPGPLRVQVTVPTLSGQTVWVAETWGAHGDGAAVFGVFTCREAAFEALKTLPNMTVWVDGDGNVQGRPKKERSPADLLPPLFGEPGYQRAAWIPEKWATARPRVIQGRHAAKAGTDDCVWDAADE